MTKKCFGLKKKDKCWENSYMKTIELEYYTIYITDKTLWCHVVDRENPDVIYKKCNIEDTLHCMCGRSDHIKMIRALIEIYRNL